MSSALTADAASLRSAIGRLSSHPPIGGPMSPLVIPSETVEKNNVPRSAVGFQTAGIDGKFFRFNTSSVGASADGFDFTEPQAGTFYVEVGGVGGPDAVPWKSATHIMYKDEVAKEWKIVEIAKKDQVLGFGNKTWIAKTSCNAGIELCGAGKWKELVNDEEVDSPQAKTDLGYFNSTDDAHAR